MDEVPLMKKTMGTTLNALMEQVKAGLVLTPNTAPAPDRQAVAIDRPVKIGDLLANSEAAKDDLRHSYRH